MAEKSAKTGYIETVGRRKTSVARVRLTPAAKMTVTVNERSLEEYFPTETLRTAMKKPFSAEGIDGKYHITVQVKGGGIHSQSEAVSQGIARALVAESADRKPLLKKAKLLTRDSRMKERRKFGLKKARKSPQWSKR